MSFELSRRKDLTALFAVMAAISSFPHLFIFPPDPPLLRISTGIFFLICVATYWLNSKNKFFIAKHLLFLGANIYVFLAASAFGRSTGEQLLILPIIFGAVLIFDLTEKRSLIFSIAFSLLCLLTLELTDYGLFTLALTPEEQLEYYYANIALTFVLSVVAALFYFMLYARQNMRNEQVIRASRESERIIAYFATSLYGKNTVEEILWDVAKNCISQLEFTDCVIYLVNEEKNLLEQKAAYGPKNPEAFEIANVITIPIGKGIVGTVAETGVAEVVNDTSKDPRYIVDDERRFSEIAVPIIYENKVIGVIDSEHPQKNFFTETHLRILTIIAALCSNKIVKARAEEELVQATIARLEAEKIREVDRLKLQFYAHLSHEFRTPLTLILGPLEEMIRKTNSADDLEQLKLMRSNGQRLLQLINDLLELSRLNDGVLNLELSRGDITSLVRTTTTSFHSLAGQKQLDIDVKIPVEPFMMAFDATKVETILINLMSNIIKFSPPSGTIEVRTGMSSGYFTITVTNRAIHIPAGQLETIFERKPSQGESNGSGTNHGIGLALSKELAVIHGGTIHVTSDQDGTRFTFSLPAALHVSGASTPSPPQEPQASTPYDIEMESYNESKRPVVLIVEDSEQLRLFLRRILEDEFELDEATNGKEGLSKCSEIVPDLVITDIMMPEMDGLELCRRLRESQVTSHVPVLMLTALADLDSRLEGLQTGADYYLAKPFEPRELLTASNNLITQRRRLRDHFGRKIMLKSQQWDDLNADERFLQKLVALVEDHLSDTDFSVEHLQRELGISRMQLHRKLKALTDKSATEFIRTIRLKIAAEKLQAGQDNVSQVAYQVGFNSLSYFTKCFKEQFGVIPSAYAEKGTAR
ncbi:MAG TPA: response regulator [Cyclobacteriaceae bacterium]|jgi:signal transduction histidine kinase/DNA-binding response OmpR family regulator